MIHIGKVKCVDVRSKPIYGTVWRWLFRRPKSYEVTYVFETVFE